MTSSSSPFSSCCRSAVALLSLCCGCSLTRSRPVWLSTRQTLFAEAERRALSRLGSTVYELLINYVQLATIISAHPAAGFWTNHWAFSWMRWLSVDFFSAFSLPGSHPALTIQVQLAVMVRFRRS